MFWVCSTAHSILTSISHEDHAIRFSEEYAAPVCSGNVVVITALFKARGSEKPYYSLSIVCRTGHSAKACDVDQAGGSFFLNWLTKERSFFTMQLSFCMLISLTWAGNKTGSGRIHHEQ